MQQALTFSETASKKIQSLIESNDDKIPYVRVFAQGGGCSGLEYGFEFSDEKTENDTLVPLPTTQEASIVVDCFSLAYIQGTFIDYLNDLSGERFVFNNPNAMTTCGCGSSFAVKEDKND